jgi:hypothetical protein
MFVWGGWHGLGLSVRNKKELIIVEEWENRERNDVQKCDFTKCYSMEKKADNHRRPR